jgi:putative hydrolases of HD superfamily
MDTDLKKVYEFMHVVHGMKELLRFQGAGPWVNFEAKRWDSVAEHTYRMALLGVMLAPCLQEKVDLLRVLKMVLVHDLVELIVDDESAIWSKEGKGGHAFDPKLFATKYEKESTAAKLLFGTLPSPFDVEFVQLFEEYIGTKAFPENATVEGKFAYALDKIEACLQVEDYARAGFVWTDEHFEKSIAYVREWADYDPALKQFVNLIETERKL